MESKKILVTILKFPKNIKENNENICCLEDLNVYTNKEKIDFDLIKIFLHLEDQKDYDVLIF
jgi:hypothetical protein